MELAPFVLPMDRFLQVLVFSVIVAFLLPKRVVMVYLFACISGMAVSAGSAILHQHDPSLNIVLIQDLALLIPGFVFLLRDQLERGDNPHIVFWIVGVVGMIVNVFSPVTSIDPDDGSGNRHGGHHGNSGQPRPHQPPQQNPVQEPQGQQHGGGQQQPGGGYTVVPEPEQVDADAMPDGESIEDMVNEIDEHRE